MMVLTSSLEAPEFNLKGIEVANTIVQVSYSVYFRRTSTDFCLIVHLHRYGRRLLPHLARESSTRVRSLSHPSDPSLTEPEQIEMEISSRDRSLRHHHSLHVRRRSILYHRRGPECGIYHFRSDCHFAYCYLFVPSSSSPVDPADSWGDIDGTYVVSSLLALDPWHLGESRDFIVGRFF